MLKGFTYAIIGLLVIAGFLYMFVIDVNTDSIISSSYNNKKEKKYHINDYLITDDFNIRNFIHKITSSCLADDKACQSIAIYKYVKSSYIIDNKTNSNTPNPYNAFHNRQGSYLDISLLYSSFLLHSGISTYIKVDEKKKKIYNYACGISNKEMYNGIISDIRSTPIVEKTHTLKKGQIWAFDLSRNGKDNLIIDVEFYSASPFDVVLFPDKTEMNAHIKGQYGRYNQECALFGVQDAKLTCHAPVTGIFMFKSLENNNKFKCNIYKGGLLFGDIKSEKSKKGSNCIKIDILNNGNFQYPGIIY